MNKQRICADFQSLTLMAVTRPMTVLCLLCSRRLCFSRADWRIVFICVVWLARLHLFTLAAPARLDSALLGSHLFTLPAPTDSRQTSDSSSRGTMKLDLKLLCMALGLVFCVDQSAEVTPCDHAGSTDDKKCQGKRGGALALKANGATGQDNVVWTKEGSPPETITPAAGKYAKSEPNEAVLTILNLKGDSEGKYTASDAGISTAQKFIVQVADCFGSATDVTCDGKATGELWLKAIGPANGSVTWTKEGPTPTAIEDEAGKYAKTGGFKSTLKILNLGKESQGTYVATGGSIAPAKQKFIVQGLMLRKKSPAA
ncbi:uncharacterized protein LOC119122347 [Syngnathus acus]|uniref:uncharacterized protein LOC119122347 n=1 Tax=Syngnathus acus TaxID=161584 RepID=UPI001886114B|nr:uncharacterized protein LOC119122347 [Syngnathus acus]